MLKLIICGNKTSDEKNGSEMRLTYIFWECRKWQSSGEWNYLSFLVSHVEMCYGCFKREKRLKTCLPFRLSLSIHCYDIYGNFKQNDFIRCWNCCLSQCVNTIRKLLCALKVSHVVRRGNSFFFAFMETAYSSLAEITIHHLLSW